MMFRTTNIKKGTDVATSNLRSSDQKEITPSDARKNDSAVDRNTNATALRIIIDSPSYILQNTNEFITFCRKLRKL